MKKKSIVFKTLIVFLMLLLLANIAVWISGTTYIYKALIYQHANINDLDLFEYSEVKNVNAVQDWKISEKCNQQKLSDTLRNALEEYESVAFLIVKNDSIIHEEYWDGYSDSSYSNSFSVAKSIVSLLIGIAIDEGHITDVNDPVGYYLPEFNSGEKAKITIKDVLQMASGLNFQESYSTPFNHTTDAYYGTNLPKIIYSLEVEMEPGTEHRYKSGDTQLLEMVLRSATGKTISQYASEKVWSKIGAAHSAKWSLDHKDGDEKAYCCFYSNARDFARIGVLYKNKGSWNNRRVVSSAWVNESIQACMLKDESGNLCDYYGYQWWLYNEDGVEAFYCRGILGQYIIIIPSKNMVIVRLGKKRNEEIGAKHPSDMITYISESIRLYP